MTLSAGMLFSMSLLILHLYLFPPFTYSRPGNCSSLHLIAKSLFGGVSKMMIQIKSPLSHHQHRSVAVGESLWYILQTQTVQTRHVHEIIKIQLIYCVHNAKDTQYKICTIQWFLMCCLVFHVQSLLNITLSTD